MPRPSTSDPRSLLLRVRFTPDEMRRLDERRGTVSRSVYIREAVLGDPVSVDAKDYRLGPKAVAAREPDPERVPVKHVVPQEGESMSDAVDRVIDEAIEAHRCRRVKDGRTRGVMGSMENHYVCAVCDKDLGWAR